MGLWLYHNDCYGLSAKSTYVVGFSSNKDFGTSTNVQKLDGKVTLKGCDPLAG